MLQLTPDWRLNVPWSEANVTNGMMQQGLSLPSSCTKLCSNFVSGSYHTTNVVCARLGLWEGGGCLCGDLSADGASNCRGASCTFMV